MKKVIPMFLALAMSMMFVACNNEGQYRDFADTFAEAVSKQDTTVVKQMIKGGESACFADIEMSPITAGSLQMEALEKDGYKMTWGDKIAIVQPENDGNLKVVELYKVFTCKNNVKNFLAKKLGLLKSDENLAMLKVINSKQLAQGPTEGEKVQVADLSEIVETFYRKSSKADPVLPSFTQGFGDVMRRTQAEAGYNGVKGYICYCFWDYSLGTSSDRSFRSYKATDYNTTMVDDSNATVSVTLHAIYDSPDGMETHSVNDQFKLVKRGGAWKIDDIIRDGKSLRNYYKTKRPFWS